MKLKKNEKMIANASLSAGFGFGIVFVCFVFFSVFALNSIQEILGAGWAAAAGVALLWLLFSKSFEKGMNKLIKKFYDDAYEREQLRQTKRGK